MSGERKLTWHVLAWASERGSSVVNKYPFGCALYECQLLIRYSCMEQPFTRLHRLRCPYLDELFPLPIW